MRWLYTDTAIIAPPLRLIVPDTRLRFELAILEFHMHFGNEEFRARHASLRTEMYNYLCSDRKGRPPIQFFLWLFNIYTGKEPFPKDQSLEDGNIYCNQVSIKGMPFHSLTLGTNRMPQTGKGGLSDPADIVWYHSLPELRNLLWTTRILVALSSAGIIWIVHFALASVRYSPILMI